MEPGHSAASHGHKQNGEHGAQLLVIKPGKGRQLHGGVADNQTDDGTGDHAHKHNGGHIVPRLLHQPNRHNGRQENISEHHGSPLGLAHDDGHFNADGKGRNDKDNAHNKLFPPGQVPLFLDQAEHHGKHHKHDGHHTGGAVDPGSRQLLQSLRIKGRECAGNHIRKYGDD